MTEIAESLGKAYRTPSPRIGHRHRKMVAENKLELWGCDPLAELVRLARDAGLDGDRETQVDIYKTLLPYVYPRLTSLAVGPDEGSGRQERVRFVVEWLSSPPMSADESEIILSSK